MYIIFSHRPEGGDKKKKKKKKEGDVSKSWLRKSRVEEKEEENNGPSVSYRCWIIKPVYWRVILPFWLMKSCVRDAARFEENY